MSMFNRAHAVREHWDERAAKFGADAAATLEDHYLRRLEIRFMLRLIERRKPDSVLDVGCGNGYSTHQFAQAFPSIRFTGLDYSQRMIDAAKARLLPNCRFVVGDALQIESLPSERFGAVITQRCIQNILERGEQRRAIENLRSLLTPGGVLALMECSNAGLAQFNAVAKAVKRSRSAKRVPEHNLWFDEDWFRQAFGARVVHFCSTYMLFKAVASRLRPLGFHLPQFGSFGYDRVFVIEGRSLDQ